MNQRFVGISITVVARKLHTWLVNAIGLPIATT
jgi:hypothetical protein